MHLVLFADITPDPVVGLETTSGTGVTTLVGGFSHSLPQARLLSHDLDAWP